MRRLAVRSALSAKVRDERLTVMAGLAEIEPKTEVDEERSSRPCLKVGSVLIVTDGKVESVRKSAGNLPNVWIVDARYLNVRDILKFDRMLIAREAIPAVELLWGLPEDRREPSSWKQERMARRSDQRRRRGKGGLSANADSRPSHCPAVDHREEHRPHGTGSVHV